MDGFPPGPRLPSFVQLVRVARDPLRAPIELHRRYGDIHSVAYPGFGRVVYVVDPVLVRELFTGDPAVLHAGEANALVLEPALGPNSVLTLDDDEHMRQRRLLLPPFHGERILRFGDLIREVTERNIAEWPVGSPFALRRHTEAITLEVILRAVFGIRDAARLAYARAVVGTFARRSHAVVLFPVLRRDLGPRSPWRRFVRARDALDRLIQEEIDARRAEDDAEADDVLSLLLAASHEDDSPMTDRELRDELVTVIGAGHETTATALAWTFERVLRTPAVHERLRDDPADDAYLDAVAKETLRARPVITEVGRRLTAPLEIAGHRLPAGTVVSASIAAMHHREDLFPEPEAFRPERFLGDDTPDGYTWIPFGGGVRRCVGAAFAQYEMRLVLRTILERARLAAPDPRPERPVMRNITLAPRRGGLALLEQRPRAAAQPTGSTRMARAS